ncbi:gluconolactonase [Streptomyces sp. AcH 505]|uniref:SMP-30/gluconolactonase/LRE family protein n=1 Tax=Streptomyces sp. AcH 505 TaxID=352211 RepID=UPI000591934D|nr:gluconolactonase [Streptomyces sp. AcH 505]
MKAEQLTEAVADHGEGPVWAPEWAGLRWVDMLAGDVLHLEPSGEIGRWHVGPVAAALRPRTAGGMVIATEHDFVVADAPGEEPRLLATALTDPAIRLNEGGCDPQGNFYCGTMAYDETPGAGTLYRLRPDGDVSTVLTGVTISNGLAWSPDGTRAFYVDTPTGRVDVFDHDSATGLHNRRPFVTIPADAGHPDGLTVDAEGGIWVALWDGAAVRHYSAAGALESVVELPVRNITACAFGGERLDELFITTSRHGDADPHPAAGALFRVAPGVPGLPVAPFAG